MATNPGVVKPATGPRTLQRNLIVLNPIFQSLAPSEQYQLRLQIRHATLEQLTSTAESFQEAAEELQGSDCGIPCSLADIAEVVGFSDNPYVDFAMGASIPLGGLLDSAVANTAKRACVSWCDNALGWVGSRLGSRAAGGGAAVVRGGESAAAAYGRQVHREWYYGPGFEKEFTLASGRRPDAINFGTREIVELKPNNPAAISRGQRQLEIYQRDLQQQFPGQPWATRIETYDPYVGP